MDILQSRISKLADKKHTRSRKARLFIRIFRPGLGFKLISLVIGISIISVAISTYLLFSFQNRQIIQNAKSATTALSNTIKSNLQHAMISVDRTMTDEIIDATVRGGAVGNVRILDPNGEVYASSSSSEIGKVFSQSQVICQSCHASKSPTTDKTVIFRDPSGRNAFLSVSVLKNEVVCQTCHDPQTPILGVLMIESPLNALEKTEQDMWLRNVLFALLAFGLLIGMLIPILRKYIINPVERLEKGVAEISKGNLDEIIQLDNSDELGQLAEALNTMRKQLRASKIEMEDRNQELSVLNEVALTVSQSLNLEDVLNTALETVTDKLSVEAGFIRLLDEATGCLKVRACKSVKVGLCKEFEHHCKDLNAEINAEVIRTGSTFVSINMAGDKRFQGLWDQLEGRSCAVIPLKAKGNVVGTLELVSFAGRPISTRAVAVMEAISNEIGIAIDNAMLLTEAHHNEQEAFTLYQVGMQVSSSLALKEVLNAVAEAAKKLLNADVGVVGLLDEEHDELVLRAASGVSTEGLIGWRMPVSKLDSYSNLMAGQPVMAEVYDPSNPILFNEDRIKDENIVSFLAAPLERGEKILGLIQVMTREPRRFQSRDAQLLMRLAHHVVVAIENARLYRRLRYLSVLEERDRLAREMHDRLSQTLGYMNVKASIIDDLLLKGQVEQARDGLLELKDASKVSYTDVREAIFDLRTSFLPRIGLVGTLQDYLVEYRSYYGLDASLIVEDEDLVAFSPDVAAQLIRIIQEALVNVRKHANANKVYITCRPEGESVRIAIEDNGQGFTLAQAPGVDQQHYGLQIMRERVESVGGSLELDSRPGKGTRVIVRVPAFSQQEEGM